MRPKGLYAHENYPESRYAIDFSMPVGTLILAARRGRVVRVKDNSNKWGLGRQYEKKVNCVVIKHSDGTFAEYLHFGKKQIVVKIGDKVKAGDLLGYSGLSGRMDKPHLHFNVFKIKNWKATSIQVRFKK
ncbi:MAG: M23 family metallopeptidase [Minisyncoccia bacterium]